MSTLTGLIVTFVPQTTNSGTSTLNVSGLGAKGLKQADGTTDMAAASLSAGTAYLFSYDGTNFRQGSSGGSGGTGAAPYISGLIAGPDSTKTIPGSTHGFTTTALLVAAYDNSSPRNAIQVGWTVNSSTFDVVVTFSAPQSNYYIMINGGVGPIGPNGATGPTGATGPAGAASFPACHNYTGSSAIDWSAFTCAIVTASGSDPVITFSSTPTASAATPLTLRLVNDGTARNWTVPVNTHGVNIPFTASTPGADYPHL